MTPASQRPAPPAAAPRPASMPDRLGRYVVEREIGRGAMAVVYLGRDPKINRVVAIKAIPLAREFGEDEVEEARLRFFREAETAGRLNHPGIVTVYDAGEDQALAFIAMEYLNGEPLSEFTSSRTLLPASQVVELLARVADALGHAHRQNVVHRDIKPANIMFDRASDGLKITDFGIARLTDSGTTKSGIVLGTPSFMSPEQLEGRTVQGSSDLFSLGVSLYQLLTAQLPFRADSMTGLMFKIANEPHPPLRAIRPDLPGLLEAIVTRALQKRADDRFQSGAEFATALRSCGRLLQAQGL
ncbi:MAG TPA: serine/threonine-protein kinase [Steroidobacteraceae bacterium]|nr:serine/threonine-protein kinase [Steroidobacteraceae bacterium]